MAELRTALVTGASRGIGKAIAVGLAEAGLDVAITARTVEPGEQREHSSTYKSSDMTPLPGSLSETAALVEKAGRKALMVPADIVDRASLGVCAQRVLNEWGGVDVIVHNARFIGPGHMDTLLGTPVGAIEQHMQGNFFAPLVLNQLLVPAMIEKGGGMIIDITSGSSWSNPPGIAGKGGWGLSYGCSKGAFQRVAGILALEFAEHNITVFNVEPGYITTERIIQDMSKFGFEPDGEPPEVVAAAIVWAVKNPDQAREQFNGRTLLSQYFTHQHKLLPGWPGPKIRPGSGPARYDTAGIDLEAYEVAYRKEKGVE